jgi:hypothetical protein
LDLKASTRQLFATNSGTDVDRLVKRLVKESAQQREVVVEILMDYARRGPVQHWREFVMLRILDLVEPGQDEHRGFFEETLRDPRTAYWSVSGLMKTAGRRSYETLTSCALDTSVEAEVRANAVRCLARDGR